jgi:hypothetical protein
LGFMNGLATADEAGEKGEGGSGVEDMLG